MLISLLLLVAAAILGQGRAPLRTRDVPTAEQGATELRVADAYGKLPLSFEANQGQTDEQVKFLSRGGGYTLFLTSTEAVLVLRNAEAPPAQHAVDATPTTMEPEAAEFTPPAVLRMKLVGSNPAPQVVGVDELPGKSNYFIGNDPKKWRTNVPHYRKVKYQSVYSGIDLVYYGTNQGQLEYDFVVTPGADPKAIRLSFEGADRLEVDAQGDLLVHLGDEEVRFQKPYVYQENSGAQQEIAGGYVLNAKNEVAFEVASYDARKPLIIDPVLVYSTYLGGAEWDEAVAIAVDDSGNVYVTGFTLTFTGSSSFPTESPIQPTFGGGFSDAFVSKLSTDGSTLLYSSFLGGSGGEQGSSIALDASGNAYVTGETFSFDFPTTPGAFKSTGGGVFVTKLNPTGSALVYSTMVGEGTGLSIAVDTLGNAYVAGTTASGSFPTEGAFQPVIGGENDAFVTKLNPTGSALVYSSFLGGSGFDQAEGLAVDASGYAYMTGRTSSGNFPTLSAFQPIFGGVSDAFVAKVNPAGSGLIYSSYLGGSDNENFFLPLPDSDIDVDAFGNAYVIGSTKSPDFPTTLGSFDTTLDGFTDAFVAKVGATGSLIYSTYLGGCCEDEANGVAVDASGNAYVTGRTPSTDFPTENPIQATLADAGLGDLFVTKLNADGSGLVFSSYLGGSGSDEAHAIALDASGNAYVTGRTTSTDFPTEQPLQGANAGGVFDAFVVKIALFVEVEISIKPGNDPNAINPAGRGVIPVAVLTTDTFDALTVSPITVQFGPAGASLEHKLGHLEDVDGDGDLDLVLHFRTQESGILCSDTEASLTGETFDGQAIQGSDSIVTVGCN